jgi:ubiquinone/menaquinone biosynthesis C-methylase UbiE
MKWQYNRYQRLLLKLFLDAARHNNEILISCIEPARRAKILEIGTDTGKGIIERVRNIEYPEIYGVDVDQSAVLSSRKLGIKMVKANVENGLPFDSNFFDIVSANQIIEHLVDVDKFVKETYRVLKPGGYLVLSTENLSSWHNIFVLVLGWQAFSQHLSTLKNVGNPLRITKPTDYDLRGMHIKIFTPRGLKELIELYGFRIEKFFGVGYYPFPPPFSRILARIDSTHAAFIGLKGKKIIKK